MCSCAVVHSLTRTLTRTLTSLQGTWYTTPVHFSRHVTGGTDHPLGDTLGVQFDDVYVELVSMDTAAFYHGIKPMLASVAASYEGNNRGSCVFCHTAVMSGKSSRDTRKQSHVIRGTKNDGFSIGTINHATGGYEQLDATDTYTDASHESVVYAHPSEDYDHDAWFEAYTPQDDDGGYIEDMDCDNLAGEGSDGSVCSWHMACGCVLGVHNGVLEYDASTLVPLGLVVAKNELQGRKVVVVDSGLHVEDGSYGAVSIE